jgi:chromosomal replication initiation ATPase DnaA
MTPTDSPIPAPPPNRIAKLVARLHAAEHELAEAARALSRECAMVSGQHTDCARPRVLLIQQRTAEAFGLPVSVMTSRIRTQSYVVPRHVAMFLARELTKHSLEEISKCFVRDHGSVTHAVRSIGKRLECCASSGVGKGKVFAEQVETLRATLTEALKQCDLPLFSQSSARP